MSEKAETNELTTDKANSENCANTSGAKVHQEKNSHSDDSDSDSDNDIDDREIEQIEQEILGVKSMLRRYCGRHKNVAKLKSEHSQWLTSVVTGAKDFVNLEGSNIQETIALVNKAEENERTRRMSIPFSADENETDLDLSLASTQLSNVHQELLHLFAIHDAKYQMECERERLTVENTKMRLHEQLLSNMARRKARDIFEMERKRKIEEMKRLTETVSAEGIAMAETNARLSQVHVDLKNAFQKMRDAKAAKEDIERKRSEEHKEMMLQEFRRRPVGNESQILEQERMRRQDLYCQQLNEPQQSHESLLQVQEQLLKIFAKLKREKKLKKIEIRQNQEDNKERMQEELVRRSLQKVVLNQEAQEKARRIKNSTSRTSDQKDDAKSKAIDMLVDVQKQLLDVFAIAKIQDVKERMNHLKVMNCRQNMLREIRSRTDNQENKRGFIKSMPSTPAAKQGKRLSLIGERFKVEVGNASSPGRSSK